MRVLLVDDHALMRAGLRAVLEREADVRVVGEAADGREAVAKAVALAPDVVVMDVAMPGLNGVEATRRLRDASPGARVIGLSMHADRRYVRAMFEAGAVGYLLKDSAPVELLAALRAVAERRTYVSPAIAGAVVEGFLRGDAAGRAPSAPELSPRERETLQLLAEGKTSKEVAASLDIAVSTVETHRRQIMAKLGLHTMAELTKYAIRHGLTSLD